MLSFTYSMFPEILETESLYFGHENLIAMVLFTVMSLKSASAIMSLALISSLMVYGASNVTLRKVSATSNTS